MKQIFLNYLYVCILPFLVGCLVRLLCRRWSKGWLVTAAAAVLALIAFIVVLTVPNRGSELYGLRLVQAACLLFGSLLVGVLVRLLGPRARRKTR